MDGILAKVASGAITLLIMGLGVTMGRGYMSGPTYGAGDTTFSDPQGHFHVQVPENYEMKRTASPGGLPSGVSLRIYGAEGRDTIKAFMVADVRGDLSKYQQGRTNSQISSDVHIGAFKSMNGRILKSTTVKRQGRTVYRVIGRVKKDGQEVSVVSELLLHKNGYYQLMVLGLEDAIATDPRGAKFFESFTPIASTKSSKKRKK